MFSYYGSKGKIVDYYPHPKYDKIIEPFAGSARYSLKHFEKDILLVDKYNVIIRVWHYLQNASMQDILSLPKLKRGDSTRNYNLSDVEREFLGFLVCNGVDSPRYNVGSLDGINVERDLKRIASELYKIRHWEIRVGDYKDIENERATWFIDPPYEFGGQYYKINNKKIDYNDLAVWCKTRRGQIIVCENSKAGWLPFKQMAKMSGTKYTTTEVIWSNYPMVYDNEQMNLL